MEKITKLTGEYRHEASLKAEDWTTLSVHASHINGDIFMGMVKNEEVWMMRTISI